MKKAFAGFDLDAYKALVERVKAMPDLDNPYKPTPPQCTICGDNEGYAVRQEDGTEVYRECTCVEARRLQRRFESSKITWAFRTKTFDAFSLADRPEIVHQAYLTSRKYVTHYEKIKTERINSMCLLGRSGCGKTHLLIATANELIDQGVKVLYFPYVEGFEELKEDMTLIQARVRAMQECECLFIDDLWKGRSQPTQFQIEQMFAVINYRYLNHLPVLISSERSLEYMMDRIDEAIGSRLFEMSKKYQVTITGTSKDLNYRLYEGGD